VQGYVSSPVSAERSAATTRARRAGSVTSPSARAIRIGLLLVAVLASAWASLAVVDTQSQVPAIWPVGGLVAGLLLTSPARARSWLTGASVLLILTAYVAHSYPVVPALGYTVSFVAAAWVVRVRAVRGLDGRRAALRDSGDVSRFVGAITLGSLVAALGYGLTDWAAGQGNPLLGAVGAFGANAAALMVMLPLFVEAVKFEPIAGTRERVIQATLTLGTTLALFLSSDIPLVVFAVMPMFAWHAFRGTLREATVLLAVVATIGSVAGVLGVGPIWALGERYGLAPEVSWGVLQLFLIDCGLILLPLSVMVTQQRMSTASADAERETLRRLVESATGTAIISLGLDGLVTLFNPGAEKMLGYTEDEVLGRHTEMFHPPGELRRHATALGVEATFLQVCRAATESPEARLWRFVRKDGAERLVRMRLNAVLDGSGRLTGYLATAEDFTEREAAQRAMLLTLQHQQTAVQRLEELERVKGDFVATVSHELRTPITSIIGYTELLEDGLVGELSEAQHEVIDRVDRNGRRLLLLVEDLLTLSQIEASSLKIEPVVTDIRTVVTNAHCSLDALLTNRRLDVIVSTPEEPVVHHGDPVQLERMVANLMTNAVKFTPDGGTVEVVLRSDGEVSEIVVKDDGMGMTEQDQSKLFTRFFRSTSSFDQAVQGTGLGLTIVQAIVAMHGGRIGVSSAYGEGTTVTVTIPRVAQAEAPAGKPAVAITSATG
jgi:PAS domain S-box-containing protein